MKKIIYSLLMLMAVGMTFSSCSEDRDSNPTFNPNDVKSFTLNMPGYALNNAYDLEHSEYLVLTTSQPDYGFPARPKAKFAAALNKAQHDNIVVVGFSIDAAERIKVHIFNYDFDVTSEQYGDTIPPVATIALSTFKGSFDNLKVPTKE